MLHSHVALLLSRRLKRNRLMQTLPQSQEKPHTFRVELFPGFEKARKGPNVFAAKLQSCNVYHIRKYSRSLRFYTSQ